MPSAEKLLDQTFDRFWDTIPSLWTFVRSHIRATATGKFDITVEQFHVLRYVRRGTESISELATAKSISRPAISQAVDVLVKKGLLTRSQNLRDRRFVELSLTEEGSALLDAVYQDTRIWMKDQMNLLTEGELKVVINAMGILKKLQGE